MDNANSIKINLAYEKMISLLSGNRTAAYSITCEYDNGKDSQNVANTHVVTKNVEETRADWDKQIRIATKKLAADRVKIQILTGPTFKTIFDTTTITLEPPSLTEVKEDNEQNFQKNMDSVLNGFAEQTEKTVNARLDKVNLEWQKKFDQMQHDQQLGKLNEKIAELNEELRAAEAENREAIAQLEKFQQMYDGDQKLNTGARTFTQILQGVAAVAPGVLTWAAKTVPMLNGLSGALLGTEGPAGDTPNAGGEEGQQMDPAQMQVLQHLITFARSLSPDDLSMLNTLVVNMEANAGLLKDMFEMYK